MRRMAFEITAEHISRLDAIQFTALLRRPVVRKNLRYSGGASDDTVFVVKSSHGRAGEDGNSVVEVVPASLQRLGHGTGLEPSPS